MVIGSEVLEATTIAAPPPPILMITGPGATTPGDIIQDGIFATFRGASLQVRIDDKFPHGASLQVRIDDKLPHGASLQVSIDNKRPIERHSK